MDTNGQPKHHFKNAYVSKGGGNESFDVHDGYGTAPKYLSEPQKAFYVRVHVNNDEFNPGKKLVISKKIKTFDHFLDECTDKCKPQFGVALRLHTPRHGRRVHDLTELRSDNIYVITGTEAFKKKNYTDIQKPRPNWRKGQFKKIDLERIYTPVQHQHDPRLRNLEGRATTLAKKTTAVLLKLHMNGDFTSESRTISIRDHRSKNLEAIMKDFEKFLECEQLSKLYKIVNDGGSFQNFQILTDNDIPGLKNQDHILVVEKRAPHLVPATYRKRKNFDTSASPRNLNRSLTPPPRKHFTKFKPLPSIGSSNQSQADTMSPYSNAPSHGGRKSDKSKGHRNNRDYDTDEGGVFKAKKQNNALGAHQVNDSRETRTEKPIDQREAEVVDEEEVHSKEKTTPIPPGTELNKRPSKETKQNSDNGSQSKNKIEVKKGGKSGKEVMNKISVLPPIADEGGSSDNVKNGDKNDIKDGKVKEAVEKIEGKSKEGVDVTEKPKDLETNDVIEMSEREATPVDLKSNDVRINNPPLSTTPPNGKLTPAKSPMKERVNEDAAAAKIQAGARAYKARKEYQAKKEAKKQDDDARRRREQEEEAKRFEEETRRKAEEDSKSMKKQMDEDKAATKIQASFKGHKARKDFKERQAIKQQGQQ